MIIKIRINTFLINKHLSNNKLLVILKKKQKTKNKNK